jgi:hypothetical protein
MPIQSNAKYSLLEAPPSPFWRSGTSLCQPFLETPIHSGPFVATSLPMAMVRPLLSAAHLTAVPSGPAIASPDAVSPESAPPAMLQRIFVPRVCNGFGLYD